MNYSISTNVCTDFSYYFVRYYLSIDHLYDVDHFRYLQGQSFTLIKKYKRKSGSVSIYGKRNVGRGIYFSGTYVRQQTFLSVVDVRDRDLSLRHVVIVVYVVGQETHFCEAF